MAVCCDLEVEVNGQETFLKILTLYSGRLCKLFGKSSGSTGSVKVIFHEFPGGAESFELISRFCYSGGKIQITSSNICLLHCAAYFMEMRNSVSGVHNLLELTEKSLEEINFWTWDERLFALKQCQNSFTAANSSGLTQKCLDSLVGRLTMLNTASPCPSTSTESSGISLSCDTKSTESSKNNFSRAAWWFEDLLILNTETVEMVIKSMMTQSFDNAMISRFLCYYQKSKFLTASSVEKCKILEVVIGMLYTLNRNSISCKSLFEILRVSLSSGISKHSMDKLESLIGSQLHLATLDNLLVPSPSGSSHLYDVNLVLRLVEAYLSGAVGELSLMQLKQLSSLMDLYISEVAPDPCLKASNFLDLVMVLPDSARNSHDEIYHAMDMYLEAHAGLSEEEKLQICCALDCEKLSSEACMHLSQNKKFPSRIAIRALVSRQFRPKCIIQKADKMKLYTDPPCSSSNLGGKAKKTEFREQAMLSGGNFDRCTDKDTLRAHLQGMHLRVMELEKVCRKMQSQMENVRKSKVSSHRHTKSLPKLCS